MSNRLKKALNAMTPADKMEAARLLLDSLGKAYIIMVEMENGAYAGGHSKKMQLTEFYNMMTGFMIQVAQKNGITPIQMLSDIGETMSKLMENEERRRIEEDNSRRAKATE